MDLKQCTWKRCALWVALTEAVGALSGWLTRAGAEEYAKTAVKPPFTPPGWVFPVVWTVLFALMGIGAARVSCASASSGRFRALALFFAQLAVNFFWSLLFFNPRSYGLAFLWLALLWALIFWMLRAFRRVDPPAARLQLPYLLWVSFAAYLNLGVWLLNR